ncbi:MAG: integrase core domain-containing protein [Elusimicrobiota bacterium]|nr:integrase core domain-containing protein [Elusimicrobiota bacterium]
MTAPGRNISISMDAKARAHDNIFVERLWHSVKYECIYLNDYQNIPEVRAGLENYFEFYNRERFHQALNYKTPLQIYTGEKPIADKPDINAVCFQATSLAIN